MKVILRSIELIKFPKLPVTHLRPIAVMFLYKFLAVAGTVMEKKLKSFNVSSMSAMGRRQVK